MFLKYAGILYLKIIIIIIIAAHVIATLKQVG